MRIQLFAIAATVLVAAPAAASEPANPAPPAAAAASSDAAPKAEKKICRWLNKSGTRMDEKVCLTKAEWKKIEREDY
ncbi:MAG TPA: hypothetical protein VNT77_03525 [Allosphingosinicella sp.]|nr:hypothetical protein [Allosphingosinicella sp.]